MTTKYTNVRIVAREDCSWCNATGKRRAVSRPGAQPAERMTEEPCPRCDGEGHRDTDLLLPGEPFFLVRGKDKLAPAMVAVYDGLMATVGEAAMTDKLHRDLVLLRERMLLWHTNNPGLVKHAD